ncbi:MAG: SLBB domain-containing protein [Proteobacteria bacterium]|nr:SLBB domain-containing protein [Pseudomonadota bacterium]MBU1711014.1 SLBB domain-containing protein [Pseudomonadota bacterium]
MRRYFFQSHYPHPLLAALLFFLLILPSEPLHAGDYTVGQDDVLKISVYDHPDLQTTVRVNGSGQIQMPLIGYVDVGGLNISQVSNKLAGLLADDYIVNPQVNVFIEEYGSNKAVILGMVHKPGLYELSGSTTLLELISQAGGTTEGAGNIVTIKRAGISDKTSILTINLEALMKNGDISQNIQINNKDNVYIQRAGMCYVTGEVKSPNAYKIDDDTTVLKAITLAAGFTGKAAKGKIRIIRITGGEKTELNDVKLDTRVLPDDVIVVQESFF